MRCLARVAIAGALQWLPVGVRQSPWNTDQSAPLAVGMLQHAVAAVARIPPQGSYIHGIVVVEQGQGAVAAVGWPIRPCSAAATG